MNHLVAPGSVAPEFSLEGIDGRTGAVSTYDLTSFRGRPLVLVFYPADNSPVCTLQLRTYTDEFSAFDALDAQVAAISPQTVDQHRAFAADNGGFAFPLLSDNGKAVGEAYGVLGPVGFYRRSVIVIDAEGIVRWAHRSTAGLTFRSVDDIAVAVAAISSV